MKNKQSIKKKLLIGMIGLATAVSVLCGLTNSILLYRESISSMETRLNESASAYNHSVQNAIAMYKQAAAAIAGDPSITNLSKTQAERNDRMNELAQEYGFASVAVADANGNTSDGANISKCIYFKEPMTGKTYISSPFLKATTHQTVLAVSSKITSSSYDGIVVATLASDTFSKMVRDVSVGQSGYGFISDREGTIVAHKNPSIVSALTNYINLAKKDNSYAGTASLLQNMITKQSGLQSVNINGDSLEVSYQQIPGTDGWSIGVCAKTSEMLGGFYQSIIFTVALMVLFILLAIFIAFRNAKSIADPIVLLVARIEKLADGDLHTEVPQINSSNEIGTLSKSFTDTVDTLRSYVSEISYVLFALKKGDCTVEVKQDYRGDFGTIKVSLEKIIDNLNDIFTNVRTSADQVAGGSEQVSNAAQALSQGATEQASSVEELSASLTEVNTKTGANATNAGNANTLSTEMSGRMEQGSQQMQQMVAAMGDISDSSEQIQKIIKTIEDIAFQTNILSLNAAVEAARAGEAGKGFAVVADEVRNLAGKSAEAAKNTSALIENSLVAVKNGSEIAGETEKSFRAILEDAEKTGKLIGNISTDSNQQASSIGQITQGVEQISAVVQTNSATSEECAAASEELSSQAQVLKSTLAFLKLK